MSIVVPSNWFYHYSSFADLKALLDTQSLPLTPLDQPDELNAALSLIQDVIVSTYPGLSANSFNINSINLPLYAYSLTPQKDSAGLWQNFNPDGGFAFSISPGSVIGFGNL